jgi:hypothetical protein
MNVQICSEVGSTVVIPSSNRFGSINENSSIPDTLILSNFFFRPPKLLSVRERMLSGTAESGYAFQAQNIVA